MPAWVVCVASGGNDDLQERKLYEVLPDADAGVNGFLRVVDDSGEDYLYPGRYFVPLEVPDLLRSVLEHPRHKH
ncbi:MAG: hypothetical protein ACYC4P_17715 [Thermoanaerobaculia bacterium]